MQKVILYTDGGARGNPGPAGIGIVITDALGQVLKEDYHAIGTTTNNEAEYRAVILGLENVKKLVGKGKTKTTVVDARLDSELVAKQLSGQYQIKEATLQPFFITIWNLRVADFPHLTFTYIPRAQNAHADRLANRAMDEGEKKSNQGLF